MPDPTEILAQAQACHRAGQLDESERLCRQLLAVDAANFAGHYLLGAICHELGRLDEAIAHLEQAVLLKPDFVEAHNHRGGILAEQGKLDAALASFQRALCLAPNSPEVFDNLQVTLATRDFREGRALAAQGNFQAAADRYRQVLAVQPDFAEAHNALASALTEFGRYVDAEASCRRVLELKPDWAEAHHDLAVPLVRQNRFEEAAASYRRAIELKPDFVDAHTGNAMLSLLLGNLVEGWAEYEWRWKRPGQEDSLPHLRWTGDPLAGRTIVLRSEQGHGDTLQFIRYAYLVKRQGGTVIVECQLSLVRLLATCPGVDKVVAKGEPLAPFELHVPLLSLPAIFRTSLADVPANVPYLSGDPQVSSQWRDELASVKELKIGVAWQGSPTQFADRARSFPLEHLADIAQMPGVKLYSLQVGAGREQLPEFAARHPIADVGHRLGDFYSTAALVENLDLVISCDSAPAHLAGALGVPAWTVLPSAPDYRWMLERTDSPWYPTMRLFRQSKAGDWQGVFRSVQTALAEQLQA